MTRDPLDQRLNEVAVPDAWEARERTVVEARAKIVARALPRSDGKRAVRAVARAADGEQASEPARIRRALQGLPAPNAVSARERTVNQAKARTAARRGRRRGAQRALRLAAIAAIGIVIVAGSLATPPGRAVASWVAERLDLAGVGDRPTLKQRPFFDTPTSAVIAAGRAPDRARYEVVLDTATRGGLRCLRLEWPDMPRGGGGPGFCGPRFPPAGTGLRGRGVFARSFGLHRGAGPGAHDATLYVEASKWPVLQGFTRPNVGQVRLLYRDHSGRRRDAPVNLVRLRGRQQRRVGAERPVGYFVGFLPPSLPRYMEGPQEPRSNLNRKAITVIAYDRAGNELGRSFASNNTLAWPPPRRPRRR